MPWPSSLRAPEGWRDLWNAYGARAAVVVLSLALAAEAAIVLTDAFGARGAPPAATPGPGSAAVNKGYDLAGLLNAHLFGAAPSAASANAGDAPATSQQLVLAGVLAAEDPKRGFAIIGATAQAAKVFSVGETLPGGAKLDSVYSDRALLEVNGQIEALLLPRQPSLGGAVTPVAVNVVGSGTVIDRMRQIVQQDPGLITDIIRPQQVMAQGKQIGLRVYPGRNPAAFNRLGLRPGDLVTAINGTPLDDPGRGDEIFRTLGSAAEARVTVMRNGRQSELTLNMAQVTAEAQQLVGTEGMTPVDQLPQLPSQGPVSQ